MKTKKLLITLVIAMSFTSFNSATAQAPAIDWQKSLGGASYDVGMCAKSTPDDGYIVAGFTKSADGDIFVNHGKSDYWVAKLDENGDIQWSNSFGGSKADSAHYISLTSDGGYIVAGASGSDNGDVSENKGSGDYWIVKIDAIGNLQWQKSYGGSDYDQANCVEQTSDGGYIVAGYSRSPNDGDVTGNHGGNDYWVLKLDESGNLQWEKSLGGSYVEKGYSVKQKSDGSYVVSGASNSIDGDVTGNHGGFDYWVVSLDESGNLEWQKTYGGSLSDIGSVLSIADDGFIITGQSESSDGDATFNNGKYDYWIVKTDFDGNLQWQKSYGGSGNDIAYSIDKTVDNGYIIAGFSDSNDGDVTNNHGGLDSWIIKLHSDGSLSWEKTLGGSTTDGASFLEQTLDGGYIVIGASNSIDGDVTGNHGGFDYWIVKLDADFATSLTSVPTEDCQVYPNPFDDFIVLPQSVKNCEITNEFGRVISNKVFNNKISTVDLSPGTYFAEMTFTDGTKITTKVIKQ